MRRRSQGFSGTGYYQVDTEYDILGRLMGREVIIDGNAALTFEEQYTYDQYGRPFQKFDASDDFAGVRYHYNSAGYLAKISESAKAVPVTNTNNPVAYYTVTAMNARGQVTRATLGNDVVLDRTYQADSGYPEYHEGHQPQQPGTAEADPDLRRTGQSRTAPGPGFEQADGWPGQERG